MAKQTFAAKTFASRTFASDTWAGAGVASPTVPGLVFTESDVGLVWSDLQGVTTTMIRRKKHPGEVRKARFVFEKKREIIDGDTLTGTPTVTSSPSGPTIGTPTISGDEVRALISGGTDGTSYILTATCDTAGGATLQVVGLLAVSVR